MKRFSLLTALVAIAGVAFTACTQEAEVPAQPTFEIEEEMMGDEYTLEMEETSEEYMLEETVEIPVPDMTEEEAAVEPTME